MAQYQDIYNKFFSLIGISSDYEVFKEAQQTDFTELLYDVNNFKMSNLGTPVIDYVELIFESDMYKKLNINRDSVFGSNSTFKGSIKQIGNAVANTAMDHAINDKALHLNNVQVTVNQSANIVRTPINGLYGTVKEFVSNGDYFITLTGQLTGLTSLQDDLRNMRNFQRIFENLDNEKIVITSKFVNSFHVYHVVISDYTMDLNQEYSNVIDFTINLESDEDIDIIYALQK